MYVVGINGASGMFNGSRDGDECRSEKIIQLRIRSSV